MRSVVICGSGRFKPEIREFSRELKDMGVIVFEPHLSRGNKDWDLISQEFKNYVALGLTFDHFQKIRVADIVFVFNKDGYVGNSTTLEIGYAVALGKVIYALETDEEICRNVLFKERVSTPSELFKLL